MDERVLLIDDEQDFMDVLAERMRDRGVLIGRIGRQQHILKLRPPTPFGTDHADIAIGALQEALSEVPR